MNYLDLKDAKYGPLMAFPDSDGDFAITQDHQDGNKSHFVNITRQEAEVLRFCLNHYLAAPEPQPGE